jgi:hypothetical protein
VTGEDSTQGISTASPETSEIVTEEPVLHSFSAREVSFNNDPFDDYLCFLPKQGSEESGRWGRIYVIGSINEELFPFIDEGEFVTITYSGEIEPLADSEYGFIKNVHSVTLQNDPREYGGKNYGVAIMRQDYDWAQISLSEGSANAGSGKLIMSSHNEFTKLMEEHILHQHPIPEDATDFAKMFVTRFNNRIHLISNYDEDFFKSNDLLIIFRQAHSGSLRYDVTDITIDSGICTITIEELEFPHTDDLEHWMIFVAIPKEITASVTLYKTYMPEPEWMKGMN